MKRKIALIALFALLVSLCACGGSGSSQEATEAPAEAPVEEATEAPAEEPTKAEDAAGETRTLTDPSGAEVTVPAEINTVVVLSPSITNIVVGMGLQDKIVGYDIYSAYIDGLPQDVPQFDTSSPDVEQLVALDPDLIICSGLSFFNEEDPFQPLLDAGIPIANIPNGESIDQVKSDIQFVADIMGDEAAGEKLLSDMNAGLDEIASIVATIPEDERKTVYFEISPAPYLYSFGSDTFTNELIEFVGATNIFADQSGWLSVNGEDVVNLDPDVILTSCVDYMDDPAAEVLSRDGWAGMTAIQNKAVYQVDPNTTNQPCQNIVLGLRQMGEAIYPEYFKAE